MSAYCDHDMDILEAELEAGKISYEEFKAERRELELARIDAEFEEAMAQEEEEYFRLYGY